jgi:tetratricopeptide (TPR) repeat protein
MKKPPPVRHQRGQKSCRCSDPSWRAGYDDYYQQQSGGRGALGVGEELHRRWLEDDGPAFCQGGRRRRGAGVHLPDCLHTAKDQIQQSPPPSDMRPPFRFPVSFLVLLVCLAVSPPASAQGVGPAVNLPELTALSKLPKADQLRPANQARLQNWFFQQVGAYHDRIRATALGSSPLVNVGPPARPPGGVYSTTFAAPSGRGGYVLFWSDDVRSPTTWSDGVNLELPRSGLSLDAGTPSTCWHESLHAIMNPLTLGVRVEDFAPVASLSAAGDRGEAQQHLYIEAFAEKTADWIIRLAGFERTAVAAAERLEELRRQGTVINFEIESFAWAEAQAAWQTRWDSVGKYIKRLPKPVKDEYEQATSTRFPSAEEVIGFYMGGDFKAPAGSKLAGKAIKIPKWVLWPQPGLMPVVMEKRDVRVPELKGETWNTSFGIRFLEPRFQRHPPVTRGQVTLTLRSDDPTARITVSYRGRSVQPSPPASGSSWRRFIVKLEASGGNPGASEEEPIHVTVAVKNTPRSSSAKEQALAVHAAYRDDLSQPASSRHLYQDTEGVFLVKIPSSALPPTPAGARNPAGGTTAAADQDTAVAPRWVLINQWTYVPKAAETNNGFKWTCAIADTEATVDYWSSKNGQGLEWPYNNWLHYQWLLPASMEAGATIPLQLHQQFRMSPADAYMLSRNANISVIQYDRSSDTRSLQTSGQFTGTGMSLGGTSISEWPNDAPTKASEPFLLQVPAGREGQRILMIVSMSTNYGIRAFAYRQYEWRSAATITPGNTMPVTVTKTPSPPEPTGPDGTGSIEAQLPAAPPLDPALDEVPPRDGDLDAWIVDSLPPPPKQNGQRWYTHPEGDYRILLGRGWRQTTPSRVDGLDELDLSAGGFSLFPSRQRALTANPLAQAETLAAKWLAPGRNARRLDLVVQGERAVAVGMASTDHGRSISFWHLVITRQDRLYYFSVFAPSGFGLDELPRELTALFATLEFLAVAPAATAKPEPGALIRQGVELHNQRQYREAVAVLDRALREDPRSSEAYRRRGMSKREIPDYPGAVADFTQSIRLEPKEPTAYVGRGLAREKSGDLAGALADYSQGIALDPNYKNAWGYRGTLRLKQKDYSGSIQDFNQALRLDPDSQWSAWAYNNRGMAKEKLGDTPGARRDFQAALALNPGDANAQKNLDALR